ncbi:MAG: adaptin domain-containing protein [Planctomycetes bacterium]|nr:adaptin domain-containing protein [Planctomycetota bacterium]
MNAPRIHILLSFLMVFCPATGNLWVQPSALGAQELPPMTEEAGPDTGMDTQLRINKTTLLEGKNYRNQIDAAGLLLASDNPAAREIVLDVLRRTDIPQARAAVCDALNSARVAQKPLKNKGSFVKPLIAILTSVEDPLIAQPAAEATLIFGYDQVKQDLENAVMDPSLPLNVRMNIIYAIKRHPDEQAVEKLVSLLENSDPQIVDAARTALSSIGISVSPDPAVRQQMVAEIRARGVQAFLRERVIWQETRLRELQTDLSAWQKRCLTAMGDQYDSLADEAAKTSFLGRQLLSPEIAVRSWALDKLQELRKGTGKLKLADLEQTLLNLIADPSKQVRLGTAKLLALVSELNVAQPLLKQLKAETDDQVRREILVALREACYVGSLATAGRKVPDDIRKETLEWAVRFLSEPGVEKVRTGAETLGKLLEQDGLKPEEVDRYLRALLDRYALAGAGADPAMRGYLLSAMAGLCSARSTCREQAVKLYGASFEQALTDKADVVRQNAIDGFVNIYKSSALRKLRENMANDTSVAIRQKLVDLAGEIGGPPDLNWLAEKLGVAGESEQAWQAMLKILQRSELAALADWRPKLDALAATGKVSLEQRIAFFTLVEQEAKSENKADVLKDARVRLAQLYVESKNLKQASEYWKTLLDVVAPGEERQQIQGQLLRTYLGSGSVDQAVELISKGLSAKDLDVRPTGSVAKIVEEYLNSPTTTDPNVFLASLQPIKVSDPGTLQDWRALLSGWSRFARAKKSEDAGRMDN